MILYQVTAIRPLTTIQTTLTLMRTLTIVMDLANLDMLANGRYDESLAGVSDGAVLAEHGRKAYTGSIFG